MSAPLGRQTTHDSTDLDEKLKITHVEHFDDGSSPALGARKSPLDNLTIAQAVRVYWKASAFCFLAGFAAMCDGYQINLNGSIIANKGFIKQFGTVVSAKGVVSLDAKHVSAWGGCQSAGQILGMLSLQFASDQLGRKKALYILWVILVGSILAECFADNWKTWIAAKLLAGAGVGMLQATIPVYISELAPTQLRGALINFYSLWFVVGQIISPVVLRELSLQDPFDFRLAIYTQWAFVGAMLVIFIFLPESPWWLASVGRIQDARAVLDRLNGGIEGYAVDHEVNIVCETIYSQRKLADEYNQNSFWEVFKGVNGWRTLIALTPKCLQQLTGLAVVNSYSTYFFQLAGNKDPFTVTVILACTQLASILLTAFLTDTVGRRSMTVYGFLIAALAVGAVGILGLFDYQSKSLGSLLIFFACLCIFCNTGAGAIGYAYLAEIPSQRWRARTAGVGAAAGASFGLIFSTTVPLMLKGEVKWGVKTGFFFLATGLPGSLWAWYCLPEIARRTPAELDELFAKGVPTRRFKTYVTDVQREAQVAGGTVAREGLGASQPAATA